MTGIAVGLDDRLALYRGPFAFDLKALTVFVVVCETGSMTHAARHLSITQSAVSYIIRKLEMDFGARLLNRDARPLLPTRAGDELRARAYVLLEEATNTQVSVRDIAQALLPSFRIGLSDSFAFTAGPTLIRGLRNFVENITVWSGISTSLINDMVHRELDAIVSWQSLHRMETLDHRALMTEPFVLAVPPRMAPQITDLGLEQLARSQPLIRYTGRSQIGRQIERYIRDQDIVATKGLEFDLTEAVFAMVAAGLGWAMTTPSCLVHGRVGSDEIATLPLPGPHLERTLFLIMRRGEFGRLPAELEKLAKSTLREQVVEKVREFAPWIADGIRIG